MCTLFAAVYRVVFSYVIRCWLHRFVLAFTVHHVLLTGLHHDKEASE